MNAGNFNNSAEDMLSGLVSPRLLERFRGCYRVPIVKGFDRCRERKPDSHGPRRTDSESQPRVVGAYTRTTFVPIHLIFLLFYKQRYTLTAVYLGPQCRTN